MALLTISVVSAVSYPAPHSNGQPISITLTSDYDKFTSTDSVSSTSDGVSPVIMDFASGTGNKFYVSYSGNQFIFYGLTTSGNFEEIGRKSIGDADDEIIRIAGDYNDIGMGLDVTSSLIAVIHDTVDNDIRVESYAVSATTDEVTSVTYEDVYVLLPDTNTYPLTSIDCDYYYSGDTLEFLCGYGSTSDHVITFGSETVDYNSIFFLNSTSDFSLKPHSNHIENDGVFNSVMMSHGTSKEISVVLNPSFSDTRGYDRTYSNAKVVTIDIDSCPNNECTVSDLSYSEYNLSFNTASASSRQGTNNIEYIKNIKGVPYTSYSPSASVDSGKILCFNEIHMEVGSTSGYDTILTTQNTCLYDGEELAKSVVIYDIQSGSDNDYNALINYNKGVTYDFDNDGSLDYCSDSVSMFGNYYSSALACMDISTGEIRYIEEPTLTDTSKGNTGYTRLMGVSNLEDNVPYLFFYNDSINAMNINNETVDISSIINPSFSEIYTTDFDTNGEGEILQIKGGNSYLSYETSKAVPTLNYDDSLRYDGVFGFYNPAGVNITQDFIAKECDYDLNADCTYTIDEANVFDREKICSYFDGETYICSDYSYSIPKLEYAFNSTGVKSFNIDIFSENVPSSKMGSFSVSMNITSSQSEDDLVGATSPEIEGSEETSTSESTTDDASVLVDTVNNNIKTVIGLALVIGVIASIAGMGVRNPFVLSITGIIMMIIVSTLGLISISILVYVLLAMIILIILQQTVFKSRDND